MVTIDSTIRGPVTVQGASFTFDVVAFVGPKKTLRRVHREYPAVKAVAITPRMLMMMR